MKYLQPENLKIGNTNYLTSIYVNYVVIQQTKDNRNTDIRATTTRIKLDINAHGATNCMYGRTL